MCVDETIFPMVSGPLLYSASLFQAWFYLFIMVGRHLHEHNSGANRHLGWQSGQVLQSLSMCAERLWK